MPIQPPKSCSYPLCNEHAVHKGYCEQHKPKTIKNAVPSESDKFYNSAAWKKTRIQVLMKEPLCEECKRNHMLTEAEVVDHIIRRSHYEGSAHDRSNLQALCAECHNTKTQREQRYYDNGTWNTPLNPYKSLQKAKKKR